jgi:trimeric autotransporter adhesin
MNPQGTAPLNASYFAALTAQINAASSCAELQAITNTLIAGLNAYLATITSQTATLAPVLALLTPPDNPTAVITWVEDYISLYLTPMLAPYATYITQLAELAIQIASLTAAIESAEARFSACTITIPAVTPVTIPPVPPPPTLPPFGGAGSLTGDATTASPLELDGDVTSPGANMVYGTNASGIKGWYPAGGGGGGGGTVTNIATGSGLTGGPITTSGTLSLSTGSLASLGLANTAIQPSEVIDSVTWNGTALQLVNDSATPGNSMYYGTNGTGTKGFFALPSPGTGTVTSVAAGSAHIVIGGAPTIAPTVDLSSTDKANLALAATALQSISIATGTGLTGGPLGASGSTVSLSAGSIASLALANTAVQPGTIQFIEAAGWNATGAPIVPSLTVPQDILIPYGCTLQEVYITTQGAASSSVTGSCTVTLQTAAFPTPPATDITAGVPPAISGASSYSNTALTSWTTTFAQGALIRATLTANSNFYSVKVHLRFA